MTRARILPAVIATALLTGGCASESSGFSRIDVRQVALITTGRRDATQAALVCGARAQARRAHEQLQIASPRHPTAPSQILVADLVTALKPGGIVVAPVHEPSLQAPVVSMRRAGIHVVVLHTIPGAAAAAAREGARATARVIGRLRRRDGMDASIPPATVTRCSAARH